MTVEDNGIGFNPNRQKKVGMGLSNINSRLKAIGGEISCEKSLKNGTHISVRIPV